jgi:hypothetical protein
VGQGRRFLSGINLHAPKNSLPEAGRPGRVYRRHDRGDHESLAVKLTDVPDVVLAPRCIDLHEQVIPSTPQPPAKAHQIAALTRRGWTSTQPTAETAAAPAEMNAFLPQFKTMHGPKAAGKKITLNVLLMQRASKDARFLSHSREPGNSLRISPPYLPFEEPIVAMGPWEGPLSA